MKFFLRALVFTLIGVVTSQLVIKTLFIIDSKVFSMVILALALLNMFKQPLLEIISLPTRGLFYQLISFVLTALLLTILTYIIPDFRFLEARTLDLLIFGFLVPSIYLSAFGAGIFSAGVISLVANFFYWLSSKK